MYAPAFNRVDDEDAARLMVARAGAGELVTVGADGYPVATLLPVLWRGDRVLAHLARANAHWQQIGADSPGLLVVGGPQAYVSPGWYASKSEHGRVVPTWNYTTVHLTGRVRVHDDVEWLRDLVTALTEEHEGGREDPGRSPTRPRRTSPGSCAGSWASSWWLSASRPRPSSARTGPRRTGPAWSWGCAPRATPGRPRWPTSWPTWTADDVVDTAAAALLGAAGLHAGFQLTVTTLVYPALARVDASRWAEAHDRHSRAITPLVGVVYLLLLAAGAWALATLPLTTGLA
ncbi:MAG TPA: FMN-binding negative transcriptional regulator, partial [Pedococcus sp.]|nr:FMN-binding negative transcriptional regulator [Pedococcus sp.]